jgi:hypothetical protein
VAVHVLARRRHAVTGRFGLRPAPGGFATPMFGAGEVVRVSGGVLVHEQGGDARIDLLTTLGRAADMVGVDLATPFSTGAESPAVADPDAPLAIDAGEARTLGAWWAQGAAAIDEVVGTTPTVAAVTTAQLWPEHFDLATTVTLAGGAQVNLGASPGDRLEPRPYLYVGPWDAHRPGDAGYWNAPFGAVLRRADLADLPIHEARARVLDFLRRGLDLLAG